MLDRCFQISRDTASRYQNWYQESKTFGALLPRTSSDHVNYYSSRSSGRHTVTLLWYFKTFQRGWGGIEHLGASLTDNSSFRSDNVHMGCYETHFIIYFGGVVGLYTEYSGMVSTHQSIFLSTVYILYVYTFNFVLFLCCHLPPPVHSLLLSPVNTFSVFLANYPSCLFLPSLPLSSQIHHISPLCSLSISCSLSLHFLLGSLALYICSLSFLLSATQYLYFSFLSLSSSFPPCIPLLFLFRFSHGQTDVFSCTQKHIQSLHGISFTCKKCASHT